MFFINTTSFLDLVCRKGGQLCSPPHPLATAKDGLVPPEGQEVPFFPAAAPADTRASCPSQAGTSCDAQEVLVPPEGQEVPFFPAAAAPRTSASCASQKNTRHTAQDDITSPPAMRRVQRPMDEDMKGYGRSAS